METGCVSFHFCFGTNTRDDANELESERHHESDASEDIYFVKKECVWSCNDMKEMFTYFVALFWFRFFFISALSRFLFESFEFLSFSLLVVIRSSLRSYSRARARKEEGARKQHGTRNKTRRSWATFLSS